MTAPTADNGLAPAPAHPPSPGAPSGFSKDLPSRPVWGVLGLAAAWYAIFLCLGPRGALSHDELNFVFEALRLPAEGRLSSYIHGPLLYEAIAVVEVGLYALGRLFGKLHSTSDFLVFVLQDLSLHLTLGRAIAAAAGLLTVFQTYRVARLLGGERAGAIAAAFCATNLTFVVMTSMCKEDALFWALSMSALDLSWRSWDSEGRGRPVLAGVCMAGAFAAKYLALFVPLLVLVPFVRASRAERPRALRQSLMIGGSALVGLALFFPFLLTDTKAVVQALLEAQSATAASGSRLAMTAYIGHHIPNLVGWPVLAAAVVGLVLRIRRDPRGPVVLLAVPLLQFLFVGMRSGYSMAHYAFPAALACFVLAAGFLADLPWTRLGLAPGRAAPWLLFALLLSDGAYVRGALKHALLVTGPRTSQEAQRFLLANALPGECVAMNHGAQGENFAGPQLLAANLPPGTGAFTRARAAASGAAAGPRFFVQIGNQSALPSDLKPGCEWLVVGRRGELSVVESGRPTAAVVETPVPPGYEPRFAVRAFPEEHSNYAPHLTSLDYEQLRRTSVAEIWRRRAMGLHFDVYRAKQ